jgi:hypothetical protein
MIAGLAAPENKAMHLGPKQALRSVLSGPPIDQRGLPDWG